MRLIHCADLHLDSKLHTHLDRDRAKRRRDELLRNFERLTGYAAENGAEAVLIAGDLFDRDTVSALARNTVLSVIREQRKRKTSRPICFYSETAGRRITRGRAGESRSPAWS